VSGGGSGCSSGSSGPPSAGPTLTTDTPPPAPPIRAAPVFFCSLRWASVASIQVTFNLPEDPPRTAACGDNLERRVTGGEHDRAKRLGGCTGLG
jgi:hypothetical protein